MVSMDCSATSGSSTSCLLVEVLWFHCYLSYFHYFHYFLTLIFFWLLSASPFSSKLVVSVVDLVMPGTVLRVGGGDTLGFRNV